MPIRLNSSILLFVLLCSVCSSTQAYVLEYRSGNGGTISGELKLWHKVTIDFEGPATSESDATNPFTDYRVDVTFINSSTNTTYTVPGYYAADGDAANTSASAGNVWRVHFAPDEIGEWGYSVSFRTGTNVAMNSNAFAGTSAGFFDNGFGFFQVSDTDKSGRDFRAKGRLQYVGEHYPKFAGTGEYFLKQGADAPENLFAYNQFDGPFANDGQGDGFIKNWAPHVADWNTGDPTWGSGLGKGLIGALNYLASEEMNAISFLTMNINGDDKNVFPYLNYSERLRMDVSRLAQWEMVMEHAQKLGLFLHFKTQETENDQLLDGGALGNQRRLYYRELIARFGHHLALNWNLGEENTNTTQQRKDFAQYFYDHDPYRHLVVLHTGPNNQESVYNPLLGNASKLTGVSIQTNFADFNRVHSETVKWVQNSANANKPWCVAVDEPGDAQHAIRPDNDAGNSHVDGRKNALWGTLMAGGWGCEYYFGYGHAHSDLTLQDFRSRDQWWDYCRYALDFFGDNEIPFWEMSNVNELTSSTTDYAFAKSGECYVVYLKNGGTTNLDLLGVEGTFDVRWFDPRNGGSLKLGTVTEVGGDGNREIGLPPSAQNEDWVALVCLRVGDGENQPPSVAIDRVTEVDTTVGDGVFVEENGLVVIEIESHPTVDAWELQTDIPGYTGDGYFRWEGPNLFGNPGAQGVMEYKINVSNPGTYQMRFRNHRNTGIPSDQENDVWTRMDNDQWIKVFSGNQGIWNWTSNFDFGEGNRPSASYMLSAGEHTFTLSGRSQGYRIDRFVFYEPSLTPQGQAQNVNQPQSSQGGQGSDDIVFLLEGNVIDDGQKFVSPELQWSLESGPGTAIFENPESATTEVTFSQHGEYTVKLTAFDGEFTEFAVYTFSTMELEQEIAFTPVDDATVEGANGQNTNVIKVQTSGPVRTGYVKFDVTGVSGQVDSAELHMTVSQDPGNGTIELYEGASSSWTEETINSSNAPPTGALLGAIGGTHSVGNVLIFDVSSVVSGNGTYTFVLKHAGGNDVWFSSKEGNAAPQLVVSSNLSEPQTVVAESVEITTGVLSMGDATSITASDDVDLSIFRSRTDVAAVTEFEVTGTSPYLTASQIDVSLEGAVFARSAVNQTIELFDFESNSWESVDQSAASRFTDASVDLSITDNPSRFIETTTGQLLGRVRFQSPTARLQFTSNTDQFGWTIHP